MSEFRFAHPIALILIPISVLFVLLWIRGQWQRPPAVIRYSDTRLLSGLPSSYRIQLRQVPNILRYLAWIVLVIALARPQSGRAREIIRGEGINIVFALDISGSMALNDFQPNRLESAKLVMKNFIDLRVSDRIGLVVFANDAFHQAPPTLDYTVLKQLIDDIQLAPDLGVQDGSAIGLGIASATNMLRNSPTASNVILLLTDGDNNTGTVDPLTSASAASAFNIKIYTIGIGQSGQITVTGSDGNPQTVLSNLDEPLLNGIAQTSGGAYYHALNVEELVTIFDQIDRLERTPIQRQVTVRWQEQAGAWLIGGLILLLVERILRQTIFQTIP